MMRTKQSTGYLVYVLATLLMVGVLLAWHTWNRTQNFDHFHQQLATTSVQGAADEIKVLFNELRRSMQLFAFDREAQFETIASHPNDDQRWSQLQKAVNDHFPEVFGLTMTDNHGNVMRPDFDNLVSDACEHDIREFIGNGYHEQGVIHPNPLGYHFDIMVPWGKPDSPSGVFFLSFHPVMLERILQRLQPPGHQLMLINRSRPGLIELTAEGTREKLKRDFYLSPEEQSQIITSIPVANTRWDVVDLPTSRLFYLNALRNWAYAGVVFGVFALVTLLMLFQLRRKEAFRVQAEERALRHQSELAHVDRINTLGEMASGIAHELNQPLSAISTYCQSGLRLLNGLHEKPEKLEFALESASRQAKRAGAILHRMRKFSSKGTVQPAAVDINLVITEAMDFIKPELDRQKIILRLELGHELPTVMADSTQIEQVILNLLYNAIEAMAETSISKRRLTVSSHLGEDNQVEVRVSDSGRGIDAERRDRIFETFYSSKTDGMGLGLSISRSIVETHGGQLLHEATNGPGASFRFSLPAAGAR